MKAFPSPHQCKSTGHIEEGMNLKDYFAAKAMQGHLAGIIQNENHAGMTDFNQAGLQNIATAAYDMAEAMMAVKLKRDKPNAPTAVKSNPHKKKQLQETDMSVGLFNTLRAVLELMGALGSESVEMEMGRVAAFVTRESFFRVHSSTEKDFTEYLKLVDKLKLLS